MEARSRHVPTATGKARSQIVILRVGGTTSADVDAERSRLLESLQCFRDALCGSAIQIDYLYLFLFMCSTVAASEKQCG